MKRIVACLLLALMNTAGAPAATVPATIYTEPAAQAKNPPSSTVLHMPDAGLLAQNPQDAAAVLAYQREPGKAARLRVDTHRLVLAGRSMGGWVTAQGAAGHAALAGVVLVSMGDVGRLAGQPHDKLTALMAENMEALNGVTADSRAHEVDTNAAAFLLERRAAGLARALAGTHGR